MWQSLSVKRLANGDQAEVEYSTNVRTLRFRIPASEITSIITFDRARIEQIVRQQEEAGNAG